MLAITRKHHQWVRETACALSHHLSIFALDVAMNIEAAKPLYASLQEFKADGGPVDGIVQWISDPEEARKISRTPGAVAAAVFPSSTLWPYKFVAHLLHLCINRYGLNLQTNTPVTAVTSSSRGWKLETSRGYIETQKVVYASNAFTSTLLPEFEGKIVPVRGQCSAIVPTKNYSGTRTLDRSMAWGLGLKVLITSSLLI